MPFPNVKFCQCVSRGSSPRLRMDTDDESGIAVERFEPNNKPLPDKEFFMIGNMVKAGVTLKEVNTKILQDDSPDAVNKYVDEVFTPSKNSDVQPSNNKED